MLIQFFLNVFDVWLAQNLVSECLIVIIVIKQTLNFLNRHPSTFYAQFKIGKNILIEHLLLRVKYLSLFWSRHWHGLSTWDSGIVVGTLVLGDHPEWNWRNHSKLLLDSLNNYS